MFEIGEDFEVNNIDEFSAYFAEPMIGKGDNIFEWWCKNKKNYPNLFKLAIRYLGYPITSVESERVFSTAGHLISKRRNRISNSNIDKIIFLNKNR